MHDARPSAPREGGAPGERELPYDPAEWSRRLEQAREARARILAERDSAHTPQRDEVPHLLQGSTPAATRPAAETGRPEAEADGPAAGAARGRLPTRRSGARWRAAAGFALGLAISVLLALLLLVGASVMENRPPAAQAEGGAAQDD